jgi:outer membrane immunogenic protein
MKKLNSSVALAALAAIFMAAPAVAADLTPPPPPAPNWTAFHIGIGGGGNFAFVQEDSNSNFNANGSEVFAFSNHNSDLGKAAWMATIEAGVDYQLGSSVVVGLLANYDFGKANMKNESDDEIFHNGGEFTNDGFYETKWEVGDSWAVGARLGWLAMENALIYVTGGYTEAKIKAKSSFGESSEGNPNIRFDTSDEKWKDGWFVGGGIEALLTENISLKGEYRYNDYGSVHFNEHESNFLDFDDSNGTSHMKGDVTVHSVRAVLSYRFNLF